MECSIQQGKAELNGTFHLLPIENIYCIAQMRKHSLFVLYINKSLSAIPNSSCLVKFTLSQLQEIYDSWLAYSTSVMFLLYALTTVLRNGTHLANTYFSTKNGSSAIVQNVWDQKCTVNGAKLHSR